MYSRRQFVTRSGLLAATVFAPQTLVPQLAGARGATLLSEGRFPDGVASGDPTPRGITLWSRVAETEQTGSVRLEVSTESDFRKVIANKNIATSNANGHTVKARIGNLKPHERYFYRFETKTGQSEIGRFQTAPPADSKVPVRFSFFSCQDYSHGYYNAHALMAKEDLDFIVCLGDYIYAEENIYTPGPTTVRKDPVGTAKTLEQYRDKYRLVRSDPRLRKLNARFPMITIWDDHEVENDFAGAGSWARGPKKKRKFNGYRAFFENQPIYPVGRSGSRVYRTFNFGKNVELIMLDERQYREDDPCGDGVSPACGRGQLDFLKNRLRDSNSTWKLIGNEVMIMPTKFGESFVQFDSWQGFPAERAELVNFIKDQEIKDVHFLTGDIHNFITGNVLTADQSSSIGCEFVSGSMTSAGLGELTIDIGTIKIPANDQKPNFPKALLDSLFGFNPWVTAADLNHHGYGVVEATSDKLDVAFRRVSTVKQTRATTLPDMKWTLQRGQTQLEH